MCRRQLRQGKRQLACHNPEAALKAFERALNLCPVEDSADLTKIFYYLAFTLLRLQKPNDAVRSLRAAARLRKGSCYSRKMLGRFGNDYGMARQPTCQDDDWKAFYSIHLQRYLRSKPGHRIVSDAEGDMIRDLIRDYWKRVVALGLEQGKSPQDKLKLFRSIEIIFPFYLAPETVDGNVISVDFLQKSRIGAEDRCRCGSGMPFMMCCGRTRGVEELLSGTF